MFSALTLLNCTKADKSHFIEFKGIEKQEIKFLEQFLDKFKKENVLFRTLINELENSGYRISVKFSDEVKMAGFIPRNNNILQFRFRNPSDFKDENIITEEFFHAFQAHYYGKNKMLPNSNGLIIGAPNIEYEARLMKAIMAIYLERSISETPSQKGLLEFTISLMDGNGEIRLSKLDSSLHQKYIDLVLHFQQHWKRRNEQEGVKNVYDHPVDSTLGPDACFYLLKKFNSH